MFFKDIELVNHHPGRDTEVKLLKLRKIMFTKLQPKHRRTLHLDAKLTAVSLLDTIILIV